MTKRKLVYIGKLITIVMMITLVVIPYHVSGEVQPITDLQEKLEGISAQEKAVLEKLFTINQKMEELKREIQQITEEIDALQVHSIELENKIEEKQKDYDFQLNILKQVLVDYQRGGPASYLEILLNADNLTEFLKSINMIKDISRNVGELLDDLEEGKKVLQTEKDELAENVLLLEQKQSELEEPLKEQQELKEEQEEYLASLQEDREHYQEQLENLVQVWEDCKLLFSDIISEITKIVGEGYFTTEDLNLSYGFFKMEGALTEDTFNKILQEHSKLPETIFHFYTDKVVIEVPGKHLVLSGKFTLAGDASLLFEVEEGSFYEMPLEATSIQELFKNGPLLIDFKQLAGDSVSIDFALNKLETIEGSLVFDIIPKF